MKERASSVGVPRFLAIHPLPGPDWRGSLTRLAEHGAAVGIRPVETFYATQTGLAYTLYEAADEASVRRVHERAAVAPPDSVLPAERVYTELLAQPHRSR